MIAVRVWLNFRIPTVAFSGVDVSPAQCARCTWVFGRSGVERGGRVNSYMIVPFRPWLTHSFTRQLYGYDKRRSTTQFLSRREVDRGAILAQFQNSHGRFFGCGRQSSSVCEVHMGFWSIWSWTWWSRQFICDCAFPAFRAWLTHSFKSQLYGYDKGRSTTQFLSRREVDRGAILAQFQNSHGRFRDPAIR